jgi:hypothetical protein
MHDDYEPKPNIRTPHHTTPPRTASLASPSVLSHTASNQSESVKPSLGWVGLLEQLALHTATNGEGLVWSDIALAWSGPVWESTLGLARDAVRGGVVWCGVRILGLGS